ncbi:mechanosensitive ion channel family protein [Deinococcus roseus]|nr:mechanosensitive ion channel family protein [Deinococcus roseus]
MLDFLQPQMIITLVLRLAVLYAMWVIGSKALRFAERYAESAAGVQDLKLFRYVRLGWTAVVIYMAVVVGIYSLHMEQFAAFYQQGNEVVAWFTQVIGRIVAVILLSYVALRVVNTLAERIVPGSEFSRRTVRVRTLTGVLRSTATVVIVLLAFVMVLDNLGVRSSALLASVSVLGLAVSFGAQSLIKDIFSGFFILLEDQYGVDDSIIVNNNPNLSGGVEKLNLRVTHLRALDGTVHIIPNGQIQTVSVQSKEWSRFVANLSVGYDADLDRAIEVVKKVAGDLYEDAEWKDHFLEAPEVQGVTALNLDAVNIRALFKVLPKSQWALGREFNRRIKRAMDEAQIMIPFSRKTINWGGEPLLVEFKQTPPAEFKADMKKRPDVGADTDMNV